MNQKRNRLARGFMLFLACLTMGTAAGVAEPAASIAAIVEPGQPASPTAGIGATAAALPKLIDLGADKCIPCRKMAPVLEQAKADYAGKADVAFIDVWKNPDEMGKYGIRAIPTQIFFDAAGKEVWRHEGFLPREEIDRQFETLGVKLK